MLHSLWKYMDTVKNAVYNADISRFFYFVKY